MPFQRVTRRTRRGRSIHWGSRVHRRPGQPHPGPGLVDASKAYPREVGEETRVIPECLVWPVLQSRAQLKDELNLAGCRFCQFLVDLFAGINSRRDASSQ